MEGVRHETDMSTTTALVPSLQSYNDPGILSWYSNQHRDLPSPWHEYDTKSISRTSFTEQTLSYRNPGGIYIDGRQNSGIDGQMRPGLPTMQSLPKLSTSQARDVLEESENLQARAEHSIEDRILDGLAWLSSNAPP